MVKDIVRPGLYEQRKDWSDSLVTQAKVTEGERGPKGLVGSAWIIQIIASTLYPGNGDLD